MLWLAAALAVLLFAFILVYGSIVQSRLTSGFGDRGAEPLTQAEPEYEL